MNEETPLFKYIQELRRSILKYGKESIDAEEFLEALVLINDELIRLEIKE